MRKTFLIAAFTFGCAGTSFAELYIWQPPAEFAQRYRGRVVEHRTTWQQARSICDARVRSISFSGQHQRPDACSWRIGKTCHIVIPAGPGVTPQETAAYRRHETAHCAGWDANHASAR